MIRSSSLTPQNALFGFVLVVLIYLCVYPFFALTQQVFVPDGKPNFDLFKEIFSHSNIQMAAWRTLEVSALVALLSSTMALPLAWLLARTSLPAKSWFKTALCLPYAIPPYIGAIAWIYLANPATGLLNQLFGSSVLNIYSLSGLVWVESSFMYTLVLLLLLSSFNRLDSALEEAARLSGAGSWQVFRDVTFPLLKPSLASGFLLTFLATSASFGVPALIGNPARLYLITMQIYTFQKMGSLHGLLMAGALATLLLLATIMILILNRMVMGGHNSQTVGGKHSRVSIVPLGIWTAPALGLVSLLVFAVFLLPMLGILISALSRIQGSLEFSNFTFDNFWRTLFEVHETPNAIANSFLLAVTAASVATILGFFLSYIQVKTRVPGRRWIDSLAAIPYATPGTVVALSLILVMSHGALGHWIYNTLFMHLLAYIIKYLSFAVRTSAAGFSQIDSVMEEAARVSGASWMTGMRTIWIPLLKDSLTASWFLIFMPVMSELTMTLLLAGPGQETLGTLIYQLQEYSDASGGGASVLAFFVVTGTILMNTALKMISKGKYGI